MADENEIGATGARRQRPPTVIDLPATEVSPEAESSSAEASTPPPTDSPAPAEPEPSPARHPWSALLGAVFAGATGGLLVAVVFRLLGAFAGNHEVPADPGPRLAAIESQLKDLTARPGPAAVDLKDINNNISSISKSVEDIAARLTKLESAPATPAAPITDPAVLGRLDAADGATKSLTENLTALSRRIEANDAAVRDASSGIGGLSAALAEVRATARAAAAGSDHASRVAVITSALRNAVEHGDPFAAELAIVKPLTSNADAIAALEPFATSGVPGNAVLGPELAALIQPALTTSPATPAAGGFLKRLKENAKNLVRIHPVGEQEPRGDDRSAILGRAAQRGSQGNVAGAMAELAKLPADARAPFQAWIAKVKARDKALDAGRRLAADAVAALKVAP
jgi:hypothetical protein